MLFTLLAERYERRSVLVTSNLVFGEWERIFDNPMAPAAAIDRLVHHAVILEIAVPTTAPKTPSDGLPPRHLRPPPQRRHDSTADNHRHGDHPPGLNRQAQLASTRESN